MMEEALAARRQLLGGDHPATISSLNVLGVILGNRGEFAEAARVKAEELATNVLVHPAGERSIEMGAILLSTLRALIKPARSTASTDAVLTPSDSAKLMGLVARATMALPSTFGTPLARSLVGSLLLLLGSLLFLRFAWPHKALL